MQVGSSPDHRLARLASLLAAQYEFLSLLGEGGSGAVYEVRNRSLERLEALKVLSDTFLDAATSDRFALEAKIAAALDHPRIVRVHAFGREEGIHWYSMQLVDGPALSDLLEAGLPFNATMILGLAVPILEALEFSHAHGVIHRDIKPANILFNREGRPFLTDFGVAKTEESVLKTRTGHMLGTPAYVSPEQALGESVDARADQYSIGITLYKTLTGRLPFSSDNVLQTLVLRLKEEPEPLAKHRPDLDPELAGILMRSLERDRSARWGSITAMKHALLEYCSRAGIHWELPLVSAAGFPLNRQPLPDLRLPSPLQGSFEPTADLPLPAASGKRWQIGAATALCLALAGWWLWSLRTVESRMEPTVASSIQASPVPAPPPGPVSGSPAIKAAAPIVLKKPAPALARRPVVYPQLLEGPAVVTSTAGCTGLRVNASLLVAEDGSVKACKILSAIRSECAEAAKAAAMRYRFKPALDGQGQPLETTIAAAIDFPEAP